MFNRVRTITFIIIVLLMGVFIVAAQDVGQPFTAVQDGNIYIYGVGDSPVLVNNPPNKGFGTINWNPDGTKLTYIMYDEQYRTVLMVADTSGTATMLNAGDLEAGFPASFAADGNILYVQQGVFPNDVNTPYQVLINQIAPTADAQPQTLGQFNFVVGCGGGSLLPSDWQYWGESGFGGNFLTLELTPSGLIHSTACSGLGLAVLDLNSGEDKPLGDTVIPGGPNAFSSTGGIGRAVLSPDGAQLAAIHVEYAEPQLIQTLVTIDLASGTVTTVTTADSPDQVTWGTDGTLFYSTKIEREDLGIPIDTSNQTLANAFGTEADHMPGYEVSIHQVNPGTGDDQTLYTAPAYVIGRLRATQDGSALLFSQIPNLNGWIEGLVDGSIDMMQDVSGDQQRAAVPVTLFQLPLDGSSSTPIEIGNLAQFSLQDS